MNFINYEVPRYEAFSTPHSHSFCAQILASGSGFQISLVFVPPIMQDIKIYNHIAQLSILLFLHMSLISHGIFTHNDKLPKYSNGPIISNKET